MGLLEQIKAAGIVGCGGAGFPTHAKLNCQVEYLIVNGAECEPLLRTDRYLMKHRASDIIDAVSSVATLVGATKVYIGLKETYKDEIMSLQQAIDSKQSSVSLFQLKNYYPAGDEQLLVCDVTGRTVPPGGIPLDVGTVISNLASMVAIFDAMNNTPFTEKYLTVTGEVVSPSIIKAPLGTPLTECIAACGGSKLSDYHILVGGPMMGKLYKKEELDNLFVTKTTSGVVLVKNETALVRGKEFPLEKALKQAKISCIQCQTCTAMCPRYLTGHPIEPHKIMRTVAYGENMETILKSPYTINALTCSECGLCEVYACPMGLSPRKVNQMLKGEYRKANIRYPKATSTFSSRDERSYRLVNSKRLALRLGVLEYYEYTIDNLIELTPKTVTISLSQHIGAPSISTVNVGDKVSKGDLIGSIPENALGANIHSSINGVVTAINNNLITISTN